MYIGSLKESNVHSDPAVLHVELNAQVPIRIIVAFPSMDTGGNSLFLIVDDTTD